jgi:hypothetical protein
MGPKQDLPGRLSGDFRIHKLKKIVGGEVKNRMSGNVVSLYTCLAWADTTGGIDDFVF